MKNFKNSYQLNKTLRFELKPLQKTFDYLSSKNNLNELCGEISQDDFFEKIKEITEDYKNQILIIEKIFKSLIIGDKTKIFIYPDFVEKLYKYSFIKNGVPEPKKLGRKVQRLTIKKVDNYLENFTGGNIKNFEELLLQLENIYKNYKNGIGKTNTETPKKVEILQRIRKIASIYIKTREILSHLETQAELEDEYNQGAKEKFLPRLAQQLEIFFSSDILVEKSKKYLKTLSGERGLYIGSFSLNRYAVNNFKEISEIKKVLEEKGKILERKKQEKFDVLQEREKKYREAWLKLVEEKEGYSILKQPCSEAREAKNNFKKKLKEIKKTIYRDFIKSKADSYKNIAQEYGDLNKEFISLQRELEEVTNSKYFGRVIKKSDDVFYLALIEQLNKKNIKKKSNELDVLGNNFSENGDLEVLEFYKLSFSAFEKLCLLPNSTLGIDNYEDEKIRNLWGKIKYKRFRNNSYTFQNIQQIVDYFAKILEKHSHLFQAKFDVEKLKSAKNFKEFEREFNKHGYEISKNNIKKSTLLELAKNGDILLFQIFCKDFVLDENFSLSNFDKSRIGYKSTGKDNLHTRYWKEFFQNIENRDFWNKWRSYGEGKLFFREKDETPGISRRYKDDKYFVSLGFQIYPNAMDVKKEVKYNKKFQEKHIDAYKDRIKSGFRPKYFIGLDQGVNSLVSYCVIDNKRNIVKDKDGKAEVGDLSLVISNGDKKGEFVEVEETIIKGGDRARWNEGEEIVELEGRNERVLKNDNSIKICDYAEAIYTESYARRDEIVQYEDGDEIIFDKATNLKEGYASFVLHKIEQLAKKYSPAIIVLEYLDDTKLKSNFLNKKGEGKKIWELEDKHKNPKTYRFGTSTVEVIENALIEKFRYWNGKVNTEEEQLTPFIAKKSDFYKKNTQWGNIVFVDPNDTSKICPKCNNEIERFKSKFYNDNDTKNIYGQLRKVDEVLKHSPENSLCNWCSDSEDRDFKEIRNGDDLAAYNIAKRGLLICSNQ